MFDNLWCLFVVFCWVRWDPDKINGITYNPEVVETMEGSECWTLSDMIWTDHDSLYLENLDPDNINVTFIVEGETRYQLSDVTHV